MRGTWSLYNRNKHLILSLKCLDSILHSTSNIFHELCKMLFLNLYGIPNKLNE